MENLFLKNKSQTFTSINLSKMFAIIKKTRANFIALVSTPHETRPFDGFSEYERTWHVSQ
jgi:hypothetical protein